jgi:hypothetical protein
MGSRLLDGQLLEQFTTEQDQAGFTALVRRHGPMVLGVCRRVTGHLQDAEDAFQATFLVLAKKAGAIRRTDSLARNSRSLASSQPPLALFHGCAGASFWSAS